MNIIDDSVNIEFNDSNILSSLFGIDDSNIRILEKINKVKIEYRGNQVKIFGEKKSIEDTRKELVNLFEEAKKGVEIDEEKIKDNKSILSLDINNSSQLDLFITGDSGPMHIAASFNIPTVSIFGPTKDSETSQWMNVKNTIIKKTLSCQPCMKRTCPLGHNNCMELIQPVDVLNAVNYIN